MKTKIIAIATTIFIVASTFIACTKNETVNSVKDEQTQKVTTIMSTPQTLIFKLKWEGGSTDRARCYEGVTCGVCPGICIKFGFRKRYDLNPSEIASGINYGDFTLMPNGKMKISPYASFDNGSGTVAIDEDVNLGVEIANLFGKNSIKILQNTYTVNYNVSNSFGEIIVDVISN